MNPNCGCGECFNRRWYCGDASVPVLPQRVPLMGPHFEALGLRRCKCGDSSNPASHAVEFAGRFGCLAIDATE